MIYVIVYLLGQPNQPIACVRECVAKKLYNDRRYVTETVKPPSIR